MLCQTSFNVACVDLGIWEVDWDGVIRNVLGVLKTRYIIFFKIMYRKERVTLGRIQYSQNLGYFRFLMIPSYNMTHTHTHRQRCKWGIDRFPEKRLMWPWTVLSPAASRICHVHATIDSYLLAAGFITPMCPRTGGANQEPVFLHFPLDLESLKSPGPESPIDTVLNSWKMQKLASTQCELACMYSRGGCTVIGSK